MGNRAIVAAGLAVAIGLAYTAFRLDLPKLISARASAMDKGDRSALYGNVDIRQVELGFRVPGRIAKMDVDEGALVKTGDPLASLDPRPYEDARSAAEAEVARLTAVLKKLEAGPRRAEIDQAQARVVEADAELRQANAQLARQETLLREGASSGSVHEQVTSAAEIASARLASASQALTLTQQGTRREEIAEARAALKAAQAGLSAASASLSDSVLLAPSDGIVLSRVRETGSIVGPSDVVYVLSLTTPVAVRAYIPEPLLGRIHPGMEVLVVSDTDPSKPYHGRVGFISPVAEFTPKAVQTPELRTDLVYRLRVLVVDADEALRQGMPVTVRIPALSES